MQPRFSAEEVTQFLQDLFDLVPDEPLVSLPSYEDQNYKFKHKGAAFVAKISNSAITSAELRLQNRVFQHLHKKGLPHIPAVLTAKNGDTLLPITAKSAPHNHHMRVVEFIPGKVFASVAPQTDPLYFSLGEALAHFQQALEDFPREGTDRGESHHWDLRNALGMRKYLVDIEDPARREIAEKCLREFEELVIPHYHKLRMGIIHGDANDHNVLTNDEGTQVKCLIDYGDTCWSHLANDVAICIMYAIIHSDQPFRVAQTVLKGYNTIMPLNDIETQKLPTLIKARLAVSVCMSAHLYKENKDPYILVSEKFAWQTLHIMSPMSAEQILHQMQSSNAYCKS